MARKPRLITTHGTHYTALRANDTRSLFVATEDFSSFERLVCETSQRLGVHVIAFCWAECEVHFVLQTDDGGALTSLMHRIASTHARHMNDRYSRRGHLFEQRYRSVRIECDEDLAEVVRYVHRSPVRLGLASSSLDYAWTSHHTYLGLRRYSWVSTDQIRAIFQRSAPDWLEVYRKFVECEPHSLGDVANVDTPAGARDRAAGILARLSPRRPPACDKQLLEHIVRLVSSRLGIRMEDLGLPSRTRRLATARAIAAWYAVQNNVATLSDVAAYFNRAPSTLSNLLRDQQGRPRDAFVVDGITFVPQKISLGDEVLS